MSEVQLQPGEPAPAAGHTAVDGNWGRPTFRARPRGRLRAKRRNYHPAAQALFEIRIKCGLTLKDVEAASLGLAQTMQNPDYYISVGRLSQIENSGNTLPSIYKLASLSGIYGVSYLELLQLFGINASHTWGHPSSEAVPTP